jgi:hypothetical protein
MDETLAFNNSQSYEMFPFFRTADIFRLFGKYIRRSEHYDPQALPVLQFLMTIRSK